MRKIRYKDIEKFIVIVFFIADFFQHWFITTEITWISGIFKYFGFLLSVIYWIVSSSFGIKLNTLIGQLLLWIGIASTSIITKNYSYFIIFCMIISAKKITAIEYIGLSMKCQFLEILISIFFWTIARMSNLAIPFYYNQVEKRISFGFGHPNLLAMKIMWCCFSYLILSTSKNRKQRIFTVIAVELLIFILTSASSFVFGAVIILLYLCKEKKLVMKLINRLATIIFPVLGCFVYVMSFFYDKNFPGILVKISQLVNIISNYRIAMSSLALRYNGITIFGSIISFQHEWDTFFRFGNYTIDILYIYLFVSIGLVYFIFISYWFYKLAKINNYLISLSIVFFSTCGLCELSVLYITTSYVMMFLKVIIYKNEDLKTFLVEKEIIKQ